VHSVAACCNMSRLFLRKHTHAIGPLRPTEPRVSAAWPVRRGGVFPYVVCSYMGCGPSGTAPCNMNSSCRLASLAFQGFIVGYPVCVALGHHNRLSRRAAAQSDSIREPCDSVWSNRPSYIIFAKRCSPSLPSFTTAYPAGEKSSV
jgi:hypothetical protein